MITDLQRRLVELDRKKDMVKAYYEELTDVLTQLAAETGVNNMFQDGDGVVYQIVEPEGRYVSYEKFSYVRTKRDGETRGSLSKKKAEEAGFVL